MDPPCCELVSVDGLLRFGEFWHVFSAPPLSACPLNECTPKEDRSVGRQVTGASGRAVGWLWEGVLPFLSFPFIVSGQDVDQTAASGSFFFFI